MVIVHLLTGKTIEISQEKILDWLNQNFDNIAPFCSINRRRGPMRGRQLKNKLLQNIK